MKWRNKVTLQQKFELKCLDVTKDILMDELQQAMTINENLQNQKEITTIQQFKCAGCI
jgi:hypothetical protein